MNLNNVIAMAEISPSWTGVKVTLTQTGPNHPDDAAKISYGYNLGTHVGDNLTRVEFRRTELQTHLGSRIVWLNQIHGCTIHAVCLGDNSTVGSIAPHADASLTQRRDVGLAILTADCLPVVFAAFNSSGQAVGIAAAHAGWRGLHAGILEACALALAKTCNVPVGQIKAWLGPAIGPDSFEVGGEVFQAFIQKNQLNQDCFRQTRTQGKYLADLYALARIALQRVGLIQISGGGLDTFTDWRWFSHRRGQLQNGLSGRFATVIQLLPEQAA